MCYAGAAAVGIWFCEHSHGAWGSRAPHGLVSCSVRQYLSHFQTSDSQAELGPQVWNFNPPFIIYLQNNNTLWWVPPAYDIWLLPVTWQRICIQICFSCLLHAWNFVPFWIPWCIAVPTHLSSVVKLPQTSGATHALLTRWTVVQYHVINKIKAVYIQWTCNRNIVRFVGENKSTGIYIYDQE